MVERKGVEYLGRALTAAFCVLPSHGLAGGVEKEVGHLGMDHLEAEVCPDGGLEEEREIFGHEVDVPEYEVRILEVEHLEVGECDGVLDFDGVLA